MAVAVELKENETEDQLIKRFMQTIKNDGVLKEFKRGRYHNNKRERYVIKQKENRRYEKRSY